MKTLFSQTLLAFSMAFVIFMAILALVFIIGLDRSVSGWDREKQQEATTTVDTELNNLIRTEADIYKINSLEFLRANVPDSIPIFIFDNRKELLFACRNGYSGQAGKGEQWGNLYLERHAEALVYNNIKLEGRTIGYYALGQAGFSNNPANRKLIDSISTTMWIGILISFLLAFVFAMVFSRRMASATGIVAAGIDKIAAGAFDEHIPEKGAAEIIRIARNANRLGFELKREAALRSQWAQDVTHDLRTPITALKAQLEGMRDGVLDFSPGRMDLNLKELMRIENLVVDLGMLVRLESPEMKADIKTITTAGFTSQLQNRFQLKIDQAGLKFSIDAQVEVFNGDEDLLLRAVSNILENAIRHTPEKGRISLSITIVSGQVLISIHNEGKPIPPSELEKVFDRLFRGEYARHTPGSGLGLTITRKIVELHNGSVDIESSRDKGTTVSIVLPVRK